MTRVLVATADTIGPRMAGPAIRAAHVARVLGDRHEVRLATTGAVEGDPGWTATPEAADPGAFAAAVAWSEVVVFQGWVMATNPSLAATDRILVADVYDPMHLEQLEQGRDAGPEGHRAAVAACAAVLNQQLLRADFLLCATERQRDLWLGALAGLGRVNPATYDDDPTLRRLIEVAPFGIPEGPAPVAADDDGRPRILWGGGIYNWFDPLTLLRAVARLRAEVPDVELEFLGTAHPSPTIPTMRKAVEARRLADELGLLDGCVRFNEGWVPYAERGRHLARATVGVSIHEHHVETDFSFRTRVLDYLWARLPVVTTSGDAFADLVAAEDLGAVVPPGDEVALADALATALTDDAARERWRANAERVAERFTWPTVLEPLVRFCDSPRRAPDLVDEAARRHLEPGSSPPVPPRGARRVLAAARRLHPRG